MASTNIRNTEDQHFAADVLDASEPVLVDFWAPWCGPCRALAPHLDDLAHDLHGRAHVVKVDIDQNPATATKYGVRSIPTLLLFKGGEVVDRIVGNPGSKSALDRMVRAHI